MRTLQHTPPAAARGRARRSGRSCWGMRGWADHDPGSASGVVSRTSRPPRPRALSALCGGSGTRPDAIRDPIVYENLNVRKLKCTPVLASARPRGRPWSTLRAWRGGRELTLGQTKGKPSRHGGQDAACGQRREGWDKRAHHGAARATRRYARGLGGGVGAAPPLKRMP